jgi:hypothetical protein
MLPYTTLYYFTNNMRVMLKKGSKMALPLYYLFTTLKINTTFLLPFLPIYYLFKNLMCLTINKVVQGSISMSQNMCLKLKLTCFSCVSIYHNMREFVGDSCQDRRLSVAFCRFWP